MENDKSRCGKKPKYLKCLNPKCNYKKFTNYDCTCPKCGMDLYYKYHYDTDVFNR